MTVWKWTLCECYTSLPGLQPVQFLDDPCCLVYFMRKEQLAKINSSLVARKWPAEYPDKKERRGNQ